MANLNAVLNDRISRLARKQIKADTGSTRRLTIQHRRDVAALKRQFQDLTRRLAFVETHARRAMSEKPSSQLTEGTRFSARSVKAQRARLGLSAEKFGRLMGVAGLTVYSWESGKFRPRKEQLAKFVGVRGMGKREADKRLEMEGGKTTGQQRKAYPQTAEAFITSLVKRRMATSAQINAAWKKSGRPGDADNTLSRMVKARSLKRTKLKKERGSTYAAA